MGNPDVESRHAQGLRSTPSRNRRYCCRLCSTIGVASANGLMEGSNGTGCHGGVLGLIGGGLGVGNAWKAFIGIVTMMAEGAGGIGGHTRVENSRLSPFCL